ncbi:MAG: MBL fold metallo-hydrolase [Phormidesmis sp.]
MIQTARLAIEKSDHHAPAAYSGASQVSVKFWGVRGSVPTPTFANQRYGGNTICVEVLIGEQRIIFDGGTGLVGLGHALSQQAAPVQAHVLFTHTEWDRIQGFPFFQPAFNPNNHFTIYGGTAPNGASIKHCLTDQMLKPHFSMPLQHMQAQLDFHTLQPQDSFSIGDVSIEAFSINPLTEALGYRLTWQNRTLVYATDTPVKCVSADFLRFIDQADLLIYDGTYADLTYLRRSTAPMSSASEPWEIGIDIAQKAQVKELVLLHHSPVQDDDALDRLQGDIRDRLGVESSNRLGVESSNRTTKATIAYEGLTLTI